MKLLCLIFFFLISIIEIYAQRKILVLDKSKNYELYYFDRTYLDHNYILTPVADEEIDDPEYYLLYPKPDSILSEFNDIMIIPYSYSYSKDRSMRMFIDSCSSFFVDDKDELQNLSMNWKGVRPKYNSSCGCSPDYALLIYQNGKKLDELSIIHGEFVDSNHGYYDIKENPAKYLNKRHKLWTAKIVTYSNEQRELLLKDCKQWPFLFINVSSLPFQLEIVFTDLAQIQPLMKKYFLE